MIFSYKKALLPTLISSSILSLSLSANASVYPKNLDVEQEINSAYDLLRFQENMAKNGAKEREELISKSLKLRAMADYAKSVAVRSGIKARIASIDQHIRNNERELDAIYDFSPLMIDGKVVPPVISEANSLYNQTNDLQVNRAEKIFKIEKQARFSSTAPNWRSYLTFPVETNAFEKYAYVAGEMTPKDDIELKVWQDATIEGWNVGLEQANIILEQGMQRLNRDYIGMIRFHQFVMQGKLTMPIIQQYNLYDNNNGSTMIVDEQMLRIKSLPTFNDQAAITSLPQHQLASNEYVVIDDDAFIENPDSIEKIFNNGKWAAERPVERTDGTTNIVEAPTHPDDNVPTVTVKEDHNEGVTDSMQNIINDQSKDGNIRPNRIKSLKSDVESASNPSFKPQTFDGIYGSQKDTDTLLIEVKTQTIKKAPDNS